MNKEDFLQIISQGENEQTEFKTSFAKIGYNEQKFFDKKEDVGKDVGKEILKIIERQTEITIPQIAEILSVTKRTIERHISELKKQNKIKRTGGRKTGHWEAIV